MTTSYERLSTGAADISEEAARSVLFERFGVPTQTISPLGGEIDRNFKVDAADGRTYVLKVAGTNASRDELELQDATLIHLSAHDIGIELPRVVGDAVEIELPSGTHLVRVLTWVPGTPIQEIAYQGLELLTELGAVAGRLVRAFERFDDARADRTHHWDVRNIPSAIAECVPFVSDERDRAVVERIAGWIDRSALAALPTSIIHQDLNDQNVLVAPDAFGQHHLVGVIDVGDVLRTARVGELVIAAAYAMRAAPDPVEALALVSRGFHEVCPLSEDEASAVFALCVGRLCVNVTTWTRRLASEPENVYAVERMRGTWQVLHDLGEIDPLFGAAVVRAACGFAPHPRHRDVVALVRDLDVSPVIDTEGLGLVDLSPDGDVYDHVDPVDGDVVRQFVGRGIAPYGGIDLTRSAPGSAATILLGATVFDEGAVARAPVRGVVERADTGSVLLRHDGFWTSYSGFDEVRVDVGASVAASDALGTIGDDGLLVQLACSIPFDGSLMAFSKPSMRDAALSTFPSPNALLGIASPPPASPKVDEVVAVRRRRFAPSQKAYYKRPPNLVRARGVWFYDEEGAAFLDAVNNVTHVGHAHPRIVEAVNRQMHRLNTNSRFVYAQLAEYADRLASKLPSPLEVVYLVCTGSEANDLALRIASTVTGREPIVTIDGAYHGNTIAVTAVSPNRYKAVGRSAPPGTIEIPQPNRYRGPYGYDDPDAGARYAADAAALIDAPAAAIVEPLMGTAGHIVHPDGYISALFADVRAKGGLCIADEVQVGFGRMGSTFWGFEMHDVVPDIVTMGKPIGNGFPLSAVVTTREIANAFDNGMRYFNTFGGNPVACAAGMAVLDVISDEDLQRHAGVVGAYFKQRLEGLMAKHELIGDVRGIGLYIGVELVRNRTTKEPAREEAFHISERMRDLGMIAYPTGFGDNILKLKPPMVFRKDHADLYTNALDEILSSGW